MQKLLTFFNKKYWFISDTNVSNFNEMLINNVVSFEQRSPGVLPCTYSANECNAGGAPVAQGVKWWPSSPGLIPA